IVALESTTASLFPFALTPSLSLPTTATCENSAPFGFQHLVQPHTWLCAHCPLIVTSTLFCEQLHNSVPPAKFFAAGFSPPSTAGCIFTLAMMIPPFGHYAGHRRGGAASVMNQVSEARIGLSAQMVIAFLDIFDQPAHAAQPCLVGIAADIDRLDVEDLARRHAAHFDVDVQDQVAHLLHPAQRDALGAEHFADIDLAAVASAQLVRRLEPLDERRRGGAIEHAIHAAALQLFRQLGRDQCEPAVHLPARLL